MSQKSREYPSVILKPENLKSEVDFVQIFGRTGPVHIEIGTGKGIFLLNQAQAQPEGNFLGVERSYKYYCHALDRIESASGRFKNVRIVWAEAAAFLADCVPDGSVDCFHIYFPDPWPKRRHHKRRFLNEANFQQLLRCLRIAGRIRIATDHTDYFHEIKAIAAGPGRFFEEIEFLPAAGAREGELTGTIYERKYINDQRRLYALALKKI